MECWNERCPFYPKNGQDCPGPDCLFESIKENADNGNIESMEFMNSVRQNLLDFKAQTNGKALVPQGISK
jgi:hypothetical protein